MLEILYLKDGVLFLFCVASFSQTRKCSSWIVFLVVDGNFLH